MAVILTGGHRNGIIPLAQGVQLPISIVEDEVTTLEQQIKQLYKQVSKGDGYFEVKVAEERSPFIEADTALFVTYKETLLKIMKKCGGWPEAKTGTDVLIRNVPLIAEKLKDYWMKADKLRPEQSQKRLEQLTPYGKIETSKSADQQPKASMVAVPAQKAAPPRPTQPPAQQTTTTSP